MHENNNEREERRRVRKAWMESRRSNIGLADQSEKEIETKLKIQKEKSKDPKKEGPYQ